MLGLMGLLTDADLREFATEGYVLLRRVVPESLLAAADAEIDGLIAGTAPDEGDGGPGQSTLLAHVTVRVQIRAMSAR